MDFDTCTEIGTGPSSTTCASVRRSVSVRVCTSVTESAGAVPVQSVGLGLLPA